MVELKENSIIKKAPAQKTPRQETIEENPLVKEVGHLTERVDSACNRVDSVMSINDKLLDRLSMDYMNNVSLIVPKDKIKSIIEEILDAKGGELVERMTEAEDLLAELNLTKNKEALENLESLNHIQESIDELQYDLDEKLTSGNLDDELYEYIKEYEVDDMIQDKIDTYNLDENVTPEDHDRLVEHQDILINKLDELKRQVDVLTANKLRNRIKRVFKAVKRLLSPNNNK